MVSVSWLLRLDAAVADTRCFGLIARAERNRRTSNASENDIRTFVTKRKISGGTVSDSGRDARDIMLGLGKTCMRLKLSFYEFLGARLGVPGPQIPPLAELIRPAPS